MDRRAPSVLMIAASLAAIAQALACGPPASPVQRYDVVGEVVGIAPERQEVVIQHQEIVGYMSPMTMPFRVEDEAMLENVALGDAVAAVLEVREGGPVLVEIAKRTPAP